MHRTTLIQLAFLATSAHAFFPYIPTYACNQFHGCDGDEKRALPVEGSAAKEVERAELLTLKLAKKITPVCTLPLKRC